MPAAVQTPRFQQFLARLFGLRESRAFDVEDIILPVAPVVSGTEPEHCRMRGELLVAGGAASVAVAAQFSFVALENPIDSGCLLIVEQFITNSANTIYGLLKSTGLGVSAGAVKTPRESRGFPANNPPLIGDVRTGADATDPNVAGNGFGWRCAPAVVGITPPFVVAPGWSFVGKNTAVNFNLALGIAWRVRAAEPGELA